MIRDQYTRMKQGVPAFFICMFAVLTMNFQCSKYDIIIEDKYQFAEQLELSPLKKSYAPGDTIWISYAKQDKKLFDKKSGQVIVMDTAMLPAGIYIRGLYQTPANSFGSFVVKDAIKADTFNHDSFGIFITKQCTEPDFRFTVGYIPRTRGFYSISLGGNYVRLCDNLGINSPFSFPIRYSFHINDTNKDVFLQIPGGIESNSIGLYGGSMTNQFLF